MTEQHAAIISAVSAAFNTIIVLASFCISNLDDLFSENEKGQDG